MKKPIVYAHRGASAYAPENTGAAFKKAVELNANGIELDVHLSKDGFLVVSHDEKVDRTSNGSGFIKDMTLTELKELDFGSWFSSDFAHERVLSLDEVISLLKGWDGILNIELKSGPIFYDGIEEKVVDLLRKNNLIERTIISSFNHYSLLTVKRIEPVLKIGLLYMAGLVAPWEYAKRLGAEALHPLFYSLQPPVIKGCLDNGIEVNAYTVDQPEYIYALTMAGIDGIITNVPDIALETVSKAVRP